MTSNQPPTFLAKKNPHPRDANISFEEGPHIYTVLGERGTYTSVTTWNHSHFAKFDSDAILDKMMAGKNIKDPKNKYYGMTREEIQAMWDKKRDESSGAGTKMHYDIECYYNNEPSNNDSVEYSYFNNFVKKYPYLSAYRTEWMIYEEDLKLSGSIDMIFENPDGTLTIADWKRVTEIQYENNFGKTAITPCISHLPDTNFWHYALQLNVYKAILERKYDKTVKELYLVVLHPENCNKTFEKVEIPIMNKEIMDLFELRRNQVETGHHVVSKH
jgi:ATP-dependent exoDNAse (exonuclease V) beta subunit